MQSSRARRRLQGRPAPRRSAAPGSTLKGRGVISAHPKQVRRTHGHQGRRATTRGSRVEGPETAHRCEQRRRLRPRAQGARGGARRGLQAPARRSQAGVEEPADAAQATVEPEPHLEQLTAEATYHRERLALYRARAYASRPVSHERLRRLEQSLEAAEERLRRARRPLAPTRVTPPLRRR